MNNTIRLRKTLFSLTLIFILTVSLLPTSVEATNGDSLLIDGVDIINKLDHKIEYTNGGYVKYDIDTNTLELNNASIEPSSTKSGITGKISGALTINVIGKNNITLRNSSNETRGIFVETDTLIINGTDKNTSKLAISILNPIGNVDAIYSSKGIISINNIDCEIEAQGVTNTNAVGINSNSNELNISDSNISMKDMSYGIILEKTKAIISNSKLDCNENLQYIFGSDSNLFINDSIVNSVSNSQYSAFIGKEYFGIFDVTINNSTFDILDKTIVAGISVDNLIINNGSVINIDVAGIGLATSKSMIISDSTIIVDSFSTRYNAIYSEASIDIKDSTIDASSDGAAILVSRTVTDGEVGSADINLNGNLAIQGDLKISNCLNSKRGFNFTSFIPNSETQLTERGGNGSKVVKIYIKDADYSAVTAAINNIPKDLSIYTDASVKSLNTAKNAVVRDLKITKQATVDKYAIDINTAIDNLDLKPIFPNIIDGNNQTIEEGSYAVFRSNADIKDFLKVIVDGKDVDAINYDIKSGSTIITLKSSYLNSLSKGSHTIGIVSKNGTATATFNIKKNSQPKPVQPVEPTKPEVPHTGIITNDNSIIYLMFICILGMKKSKKSTEFTNVTKNNY